MRRLGERGLKASVLAARTLDEAAERAPALGDGDVVVNCVGYYGTDAAHLRQSNVDHAGLTAQRVREHGAALVHVSSSAVFDGIRRGRIAESTTPAPTTPYGRSKAEGEAAVRELHPQARVVRPSKIFGGQDPRRRLHSLLRHVERGRPLPVPPGKRLYANFVWVGDAANVLAEETVEPSGDRVIHLATPCPLQEFVGLLAEAVGTPVPTGPRVAQILLGPGASLLARRPGRLPRRLERVVELWDEREFVDSRGRFPRHSLRHGLAELAERAL